MILKRIFFFHLSKLFILSQKISIYYSLFISIFAIPNAKNIILFSLIKLFIFYLINPIKIVENLLIKNFYLKLRKAFSLLFYIKL